MTSSRINSHSPTLGKLKIGPLKRPTYQGGDGHSRVSVISPALDLKACTTRTEHSKLHLRIKKIEVTSLWKSHFFHLNFHDLNKYVSLCTTVDVLSSYLSDTSDRRRSLGATHIEYTVAGVNRQFTLTQGASGTSQIFPAKKLQADFCSGSQSVAGVNRQCAYPFRRKLRLHF